MSLVEICECGPPTWQFRWARNFIQRFLLFWIFSKKKILKHKQKNKFLCSEKNPTYNQYLGGLYKKKFIENKPTQSSINVPCAETGRWLVGLVDKLVDGELELES